MSNHFDASGQAHMVDISGKSASARTAIATAIVSMSSSAAQSIRQGTANKGDVIGIARLAGIMGCKHTPMLIPLCHPIPIERVTLEFEWQTDDLRITATVTTSGKTGVEMEAMTAASVAALTVYDMIKSVDRWVTVASIQLQHKSGGKSGTLSRSS